jgi:hypothetical protein
VCQADQKLELGQSPDETKKPKDSAAAGRSLRLACKFRGASLVEDADATAAMPDEILGWAAAALAETRWLVLLGAKPDEPEALAAGELDGSDVVSGAVCEVAELAAADATEVCCLDKVASAALVSGRERESEIDS